MKKLQRVVWSEGMFVTPQHMQQQDRYHESRTLGLLRAVAPNYWGVAELAVDEAALKGGVFGIRRMTGVLPDGQLVEFESGDAHAPSPRPVGEHLAPKSQSLNVYIGLPREREGVANVGSDADVQGAASLSTRYRRTLRTVLEMSDALTPAVTVEFAEPVLTILFGNEVNADYETIKIAEITREAGGQLGLIASYVPPALRLGASRFVMDGLHGMLGMLTAKQRNLADAVKQRTTANTEFQAGDLTSYLQLSAVNGAIPVVSHLCVSVDAAPYQAFLALSQLAGQLATFSTTADPTKLPIFDHTDLRTTFGALFTGIGEVLTQSFVGSHVKIVLQARTKNIMAGKLDDESVRASREIILSVVSNTLPSEMIATNFPRVTKMCGESDLASLSASATAGIKLRMTNRPPTEVPTRANNVYFSIDPDDPLWRNAVEQRSVALQLPAPFDSANLVCELYAISRRQTEK